MMRFRLRPTAQRDLAETWLRTADRWGVDQAEHYVRAIELRIESLTEFPERGSLVQTRHGEFRKMASGHHLIFYLVGKDEIDVVRVLHERVDVDERLG